MGLDDRLERDAKVTYFSQGGREFVNVSGRTRTGHYTGCFSLDGKKVFERVRPGFMAIPQIALEHFASVPPKAVAAYR